MKNFIIKKIATILIKSGLSISQEDIEYFFTKANLIKALPAGKDEDKILRDHEYYRYVKAYPGDGESVMYETANRVCIYKWTQGSRSWRNNNPGYLLPGEISKSYGSIGVAGGYACFPNKDVGRTAFIEHLNQLLGEGEIRHQIQTLINMTIVFDFGEVMEYFADFLIKRLGFTMGYIIPVDRSERYVWRTRNDEKVRSAHRAREGKKFYWYKPPVDGHPGQAPGCRCIAENINIKDKDLSSISQEEINQLIQSNEYKTDVDVQNLVTDYFKYHYD